MEKRTVTWRGLIVEVTETREPAMVPWDGDEPLEPGSEGWDLAVGVKLTVEGHAFEAHASLCGNWISPDREGFEYLDSQVKDLTAEALDSLSKEVARVATGEDVRKAEARGPQADRDGRLGIPGVSLSDAERAALIARVKAHTRNATKRISEGFSLGRVPLYSEAFAECVRTKHAIEKWDGDPELLEKMINNAEDLITKKMAEGDALTSMFPPGSAEAFGRTSGLPVVERKGSACHQCGRTVYLEELGPDTDPDEEEGFKNGLVTENGMEPPSFLVHEARGEVLLFVMHRLCWSSTKRMAGRDRDPARADRGRTFREVQRDEWLLLLIAKEWLLLLVAKDVLCS